MWYRPDRRDAGGREAQDRRRAWLLVGFFAAAVMAAVALGPKVPPLGTPNVAADAGQAVGDPPARPAIYRPCKTMAWLNLFGGCGPRVGGTE